MTRIVRQEHRSKLTYLLPHNYKEKKNIYKYKKARLRWPLMSYPDLPSFKGCPQTFPLRPRVRVDRSGSPFDNVDFHFVVSLLISAGQFWNFGGIIPRRNASVGSLERSSLKSGGESITLTVLHSNKIDFAVCFDSISSDRYSTAVQDEMKPIKLFSNAFRVEWAGVLGTVPRSTVSSPKIRHKAAFGSWRGHSDRYGNPNVVWRTTDKKP